MANIKTLNDAKGNKIYPKTSTSAVYDNDGKRLDAIINDAVYTKEASDSGVDVITNPIDATSLDGHSSDYYATNEQVAELSNGLGDINSDVNTLTNKVNVVSRDVSATNARLSQMIANAESGADISGAELADARLKRDGTAATTIGDAIREQLDQINKELIATNDNDVTPVTMMSLSTNRDSVVEVLTHEDLNEIYDELESKSKKIDEIDIAIDSSIVDGYVEDGFLYLTTAGGNDIGPFGPFSGTGGGGSGGSGSGNNATITLTNTTGWLSTTITDTSDCVVTVDWSSLEGGNPTGDGILTVKVAGAIKASKTVPQGQVSINIKDYLVSGNNRVTITITDVYGNSKYTIFSVSKVSMILSSTFDSSITYNSDVVFNYVAVGSVDKTVHFILDNVEIDSTVVSTSNRPSNFTIPKQSHGAHKFEVYFDAEVNGQPVTSNHLVYDIMFVESDSTTSIIASAFNVESITRYYAVTVPYIVITPNSLTSDVTLSVNGKIINTLTVNRTLHEWIYQVFDNTETIDMSISTGSGDNVVTKTFTLSVLPSDMMIEAVKTNLSLFLTSQGRSNSESDPSKWECGDIKSTLTGFNFKSDGWVTGYDGATCLRVAGDARVNIPYEIFGQDFRTTGKTIEFEFCTSSVLDYSVPIISCLDNGRGFVLTPQMATLTSEKSSISMQYKEGEHVRVSFVVEKSSANRLILLYINGIISGCVQYSATDNFQQAFPVGITIGSDKCVVDVYNIRVYDEDLTRHGILDNWIADTPDGATMIDRYEHNNIYDDYGEISVNKLPSDLPYMILNADELPQFKGDKKVISGIYVDPINSSKSFTFTNASCDVQGTSSQYYARKNYKIKFKNFVNNDGETSTKYKLRDSSVPASTFTFKADVASSEGANNVELVRLYNDICTYRTPPQKTNSSVRQGIDGFPIVVFWNDGENTRFLGKYNFNDDKSSTDVFGFTDGAESWEILNNTSSRVLWTSDDFDSKTTDDDGNEIMAWTKDFEARYPDDNTNITNLKALSTWLVSTNQAAATNSALSKSVTYDGKTYTNDTAEYRLAKFKNEFANYVMVDSAVFYYVFTEFFLMVDSRAKNAFPTVFPGDNGKWCFLPYDFDTAIGINNEGKLAFTYSLEDIDTTESGAKVFNGQDSVLWVNLRAAFYKEISDTYKALRTGTKSLTYLDTVKRFSDHQDKWPEAIFNEDAYFKYIDPLITNNEGVYLAMCQGSKAEQRKWWLYNRFKYMDSKYNTGDAASAYINFRAYQSGDFHITPYIDLYLRVKSGSYSNSVRGYAGQEYTIHCDVDAANDTETMIFSADQIMDIGDISVFKPGYCNIAAAVNLQRLIIGCETENSNFTELKLGNNKMLREIDLRNCPKLVENIDLTSCINLEKAYFQGTGITGVDLPDGGRLTELHLPDTVKNITIINNTKLTVLDIPSYEGITTLRLENTPIPQDQVLEIIDNMAAGSRIRLTGIDWTFDNDDIFAYGYLDKFTGMDEKGNNTDFIVLSGKVHFNCEMGITEMEICKSLYPYVTFTADTIVNYTKRLERLHNIVQQNTADKYFSVGDQIIVPWVDTNGKEYNMPFDITHIGTAEDADGNIKPAMYLQAHYTTVEAIQFNHTDSERATEPTALEGYYYYGYDKAITDADSGANAFTLLNVNTGDILPYDNYTYIVRSSIYDTTRNICRYGYNRYMHSAVRQFINSTEGVGLWWTEQYPGNVAPDQLSTVRGWAAGFRSDFLNILGTSKVVVARNTVTKPDKDGTYDVMYDKFFLPSLQQMNIAPQITGEGETWDYYKQLAMNDSNDNLNDAGQYKWYPETYDTLIKYALNAKTSSQYVRLRSSHRGYSCLTWGVTSFGYVYSYGAYLSWRLAPACVIM